MKYLFIDSATANIVVAFVINDKIKYMYQGKHDKDVSSILLPKIKEGLEQENILPKDLNKIFVVNGPGSFTGIRVGLTVAKTMAWALKTPVIPISSLEVIASSAYASSNIALIDARRGYVFAGAYDKELNNTYEDKYIKLEDIKIEGTYISYDDISPKKPTIDIIKIIKKHENEKGINPHTLNPKYLKQTEAEEKLKLKNDRTN